MTDEYILAVHFQYMNDNGRLARELFESRKPFIASIVPNLLDSKMKTEEGEDIFNRIHPSDNYYPEWAKEIFRENSNNPNVSWAQEGYRHCCGKCYNKRQNNHERGSDPYHEHVCLNGHAQSLEKQIEVIRKGKNLIKEELGITPLAYCPPNHLYNKDTLESATENCFSYFLTRNGFDYFIPGLIKLPAYDNNELIVLPETKKGKSPIIMTYYDHISSGKVPNWRELLENSTSLGRLEITYKPKIKVWMNEKLILSYKKIRDLIR